MQRVVVNRELLALFAARRIYHRPYGGERWRVGDVLGAHSMMRLEPYSHIFSGYRLPRTLGAFSYSHAPLGYCVRVGRYCSIAQEVSWMDPHHQVDWITTSPFCLEDNALPGMAAYRALYPEAAEQPWKVFERNDPTVTIGNDVWIGQGAMIAPGVSIGDGAIVGARALVLKDVPPYAIVGGTPAKIIRQRFPEEIATRLQALAWWRFPPVMLQDMPMEDPARFVEAMEARVATTDCRPMSPIPLTLADVLAVTS